MPVNTGKKWAKRLQGSTTAAKDNGGSEKKPRVGNPGSQVVEKRAGSRRNCRSCGGVPKKRTTQEKNRGKTSDELGGGVAPCTGGNARQILTDGMGKKRARRGALASSNGIKLNPRMKKRKAEPTRKKKREEDKKIVIWGQSSEVEKRKRPHRENDASKDTWKGKKANRDKKSWQGGEFT